MNEPDPKPPGKSLPRFSPHWGFPVGYILLTLLILWVWQDAFRQATVQTIPYSQFKTYLARGEVTACSIEPNEIDGKIVPKPSQHAATRVAAKEVAVARTPATRPTADARAAVATATKPAVMRPAKPFRFRTVRVDDPRLVDQLQAAHVKFLGVRPGFLSQFLWAWILPIGAMVLLWVFLTRRAGSAGAGQSVVSFGKSRAKVVADRSTGVTFGDVAGCDEAKVELEEVVDFLKNPGRYQALGAQIPRGVLLIGPPGTGKTLLARAVAGQAGVPFFSISGSDFVEMFVGVGAARVRDLFQQAKAQAPCIVFIDELDAIGRQRGVHLGTANDEREQTLDQMLVEMDGFEANAGVIILAATNRPEVLDHALLRPGRFDRQVLVDSPDIDGREAILRVHARNKPLAPDSDLRRIAQSTPGFSGADLANAINEAALLAARHRSARITQKDLDDAVEKVVAGPERRSRRLGEEERRRVAYHESGHALVAAYSGHADPLHKISIVPHGRAALGYTMRLPTDDRFLMSRSQLVDQIKGLLGGRAAEDVVFEEVTTGAENDLERATTMARQMVCVYGMGKSAGLLHCGQRQSPFLPASQDGGLPSDCSERIAESIDEEVKQLLDHCYTEAKAILMTHRHKLERIARELLTREVLDRETFEGLLAEDRPAPAVPLAPWVPAAPVVPVAPDAVPATT
jgi:cell division protease FtsH